MPLWDARGKGPDSFTFGASKRQSFRCHIGDADAPLPASAITFPDGQWPIKLNNPWILKGR